MAAAATGAMHLPLISAEGYLRSGCPGVRRGRRRRQERRTAGCTGDSLEQALASSVAAIQTYVSGDLGMWFSPRARPLADAPIEALLARADELARRWAITLVLARPLEGIGELPLDDLAREAPLLCAQVVRALASDAELERLAGGQIGEVDSHAATLGELAGAQSAQAAVAAAESLRGVIWEAALEELRWPSLDRPAVRQVADLGDRLAYVCATALAATLARGPAVQARPASPGSPAGGRDEVIFNGERPPPGRRGIRVVDEREGITTAARQPAAGASAQARVRGTAGHAVDTRRVRPPAPSHDELVPDAPLRSPGHPDAQPPSDHEPIQARPLPWDIPLGAERPGHPASQSQPRQSDVWISDSAADGDDRVMRISRRPRASTDEPA